MVTPVVAAGFFVFSGSSPEARDCDAIFLREPAELPMRREMRRLEGPSDGVSDVVIRGQRRVP